MTNPLLRNIINKEIEIALGKEKLKSFINNAFGMKIV